MDLENELQAAAHELAATLGQKQIRVVLAESCTGGQASAALTQISGISRWYCGSAVTYREATKQHWLGVPATELARWSAESEQVTRQMALGALNHTPEADWSAAVTGHLGPGAPPDRDGVIFLAVAAHAGSRLAIQSEQRYRLGSSARLERQHEAAAFVLRELRAAIVRGAVVEDASED